MYMMMYKKFSLETLVLAALFCFSFEMAGQSVLRSGYSGSVEVGALVQKYPYMAVSTSHGATNDRGLFLGGGVMVEFPVAVAPKFDADPTPAPGPFEKDRLAGVFFEARYAFLGASFAPYLDLKVGPAYNLDSKSFQNGFVRPSVGLSFGSLSVSAGVEATVGTYVVERSREHYAYLPDIEYDLYGKCLPYMSCILHF